MRTQRERIFVADFETTVYDGQKTTDVWAAAIVELFTETVSIYHSIDELFDAIISLHQNQIIYFHNLKFDGEFWINFLLTRAEYKPGFIVTNEKTGEGVFKERKELRTGEFIYSISDRGQWYRIILKSGTNYIELRDSLKLLPISVEKMGKSFGTKHKKLTMKYYGIRYPGCPISDEEKQYIVNDVLVVKEAIEIMYTNRHKSLTIGSCCLAEYKSSCIFHEWERAFPNLYEISFGEASEQFGSENYGQYIRKSYHGGWCYLVDGEENKPHYNGTTADVNSLYPSMMHSESGNEYPIGEPTFWVGNYIPDEAKKPHRYYFVRIKTQFRLRDGKLPCIQIKGNIFYSPTKWLETSDIKSRIDGMYHSTHLTIDGEVIPATVTLTLTMTDFQLIREHYILYNTEILDGCYFTSMAGIFDEYIDKYKAIKTTSKGAVREIAKLFLNNLYGKFATNTDSSFKVAYLKPDNSIGYYVVKENKKKPGFVPIGTAVTSYARNFTIRAAQANYHPGKPGFIYADTDSIHCDLPPDQIQAIKVHDTDFCCWKLESCWDEARFIRQKCYAEHITHSNLKPVEEPYWDMKCAGMPDNCKDLFIASMNPATQTILKDGDVINLLSTDYTQDELNFLKTHRTINDFKIGLEVPGKLTPKHIPGGVLLTSIPYTMRKDVRMI